MDSLAASSTGWLIFAPARSTSSVVFTAMICGVREKRADGERRRLVIRAEFGAYERTAQGNIAGLRQKDFAPDAHVFIGRRGIPIDPSETEIIFFRGEDFDSESVRAIVFQQLIDAKFKGAISAGHVGAIGDFRAVQPNVCAIVDAEEMEPRRRLSCAAWRGKLSAKPERATIRAVRGHISCGEQRPSCPRQSRETT